MYRTAELLFLGACTLCAFLRAEALSNALCTSYGSTWVTASPHLTGKFPYYSMIFSCTGDLNIEGRHVDLCMHNGLDCGQKVAQAFCEYLGFDGAVADRWSSAVADAPARSMTGEWCAAENSYQNLGALNRTQFEALASSSAARTGPPCNRLDAVTCYRTRNTFSKAWDKLNPPVAEALARAPAPAAEQASMQRLATFVAGAPLPSLRGDLVSGATAVGGRRRLRQA